ACAFAPIRPLALRIGMGVLLSAGALAALLGPVRQQARLEERMTSELERYSAAPEFGQPIALLQRWGAGPGRVAVLGTFNELSEALVRWSIVQAWGYRPRLVEPLSRFRADLPEPQVRAELAR